MAIKCHTIIAQTKSRHQHNASSKDTKNRKERGLGVAGTRSWQQATAPKLPSHDRHIPDARKMLGQQSVVGFPLYGVLHGPCGEESWSVLQAVWPLNSTRDTTWWPLGLPCTDNQVEVMSHDVLPVGNVLDSCHDYWAVSTSVGEILLPLGSSSILPCFSTVPC